jgi:nucleotide-binding universal stress UspA family protein
MNNRKRILAPTDFSALSKVGLRHALEMGKSEGAEVIVFHAIGPTEAWLIKHNDFSSVEQLIAERKRFLSKFLKANFAGILPQVAVQEEVEVGVPYKMIVEKAREERVNIIVMSTHGASGLTQMMGSLTGRVISRAPCPVLSIPPTEEANSPMLCPGENREGD